MQRETNTCYNFSTAENIDLYNNYFHFIIYQLCLKRFKLKLPRPNISTLNYHIPENQKFQGILYPRPCLSKNVMSILH